MSPSYVSIWEVLACCDVQCDVCWFNCLIFLDLGSISRHIDCVSIGRRRKILNFHGAGAFLKWVTLEIPAAVSL